MDSMPVTVGIGYKGSATGTAANPGMTNTVEDAFTCALTGSGKQGGRAVLTLTPGEVRTLNLRSGLTDLLGEAITEFDHVYAVVVEHDPASLATSGVRAFGAGSNDFQGPLSAGSRLTFLPGQGFAFLTNAALTPWETTDAVKNIALENLDLTNDATVNVAFFGTKE
jgi:hypothetical protein